MVAIKKILFPVDFSDQCIGAARYVEAFAGRFEAEVILLHVVADGDQVLARELQPARQAQLNAFLADEFKYFNINRQCVTGDPASQIAQLARSWNPDLIMMPSHGLGFFRRLLLGSVTAKVLHDVDCPVWTGAHADKAPPLERIGCSRVLCAVDLTERSGSVLQWAAGLAREYDAQLGIVHAIPSVEASAAAQFLDREYVADVEVVAEKAIARLQEAAGTDAVVLVDGGETSQVVRCATKEFKADLLVIGRHSRTGLAGHLRHSAYGILRESLCPVISI
jgi:nucleotide-binding universal stress UspA family protein